MYLCWWILTQTKNSFISLEELLGSGDIKFILIDIYDIKCQTYTKNLLRETNFSPSLIREPKEGWHHWCLGVSTLYYLILIRHMILYIGNKNLLLSLNS